MTWLYGPLHTAVEAVPPPKQATTSDRLGLEPLRSLSDSKTVSKGATKANAVEAKKADPELDAAVEAKKNIKPILKYRSLSDILLPPGMPGSPSAEEPEHDFDGSDATISVHHARSDSHLVRLNSLNRKRRSPVHSPREQSPERGFASDASSNSTLNKRHISFNHRVEQCIAVDSTEDNSRYSSLRSSSIHRAQSSDSEDDGEDEVLTFKSSPRVANFGAGVHDMTKQEPHTIARLGPTTLKSVELYPAPSPAVFYPDSPEKKLAELPVASSPPDGETEQVGPGMGAGSPYPGQGQGQAVNTYTARGAQGGARTVSGRRPVSYNNTAVRDADYEDDDDYAMGFDYPLGPDVGVGDDYDNATYGSQHLVGGHHNGFQAGSADFPGNGASYSTSPGGGYPRAPQSASPNKQQPSSGQVSVASAATRGPHSPTSAKDAHPPKKSILKGRARENSNEDGAIPIGARFGSPSGSNVSGSPGSSQGGSYTPVSSSGVVATAIPQHVRPGARRTGSSDEASFRAEGGRGRSASRGSSSSLERGMSADRRSSSSISPSSYSPPGSAVGSPARTAIGNGGLVGPRRNSSFDSLNALGNLGAGPASASAGSSRLGDLIEGSSESEAETVRQHMTSSSESDDDDLPAIQSQSMRGRQLSSGSSDNAMIERVEDVSASIDNLAKSGTATATGAALPASVLDSEMVASPGAKLPEDDKSPLEGVGRNESDDVTPVATPAQTPTLASAARMTSPLADHVAPSSPSTTEYPKPAAGAPSAPLPKGPTSPPLAAPTAITGTRVGSGPRFRQPSPSTTTTSTSAPDDDGSSTAVPSPAQLRSLSNSPALDPADAGEPKWSDEAPAGAGASSARSSLLKAAKRSPSQHELSPATSRTSVEQRRTASASASTGEAGHAQAPAQAHEDGFGYLEDEEQGLVGRTLEVSRDLLGALGKGLWSLGGGKHGSKK